MQSNLLLDEITVSNTTVKFHNCMEQSSHLMYGQFTVFKCANFARKDIKMQLFCDRLLLSWTSGLLLPPKYHSLYIGGVSLHVCKELAVKYRFFRC